MLRAGVDSFDMSPRPGVELAGYPTYPRANAGVHDPLIASCLYLENGGVEVAIVTLDILSFSKSQVAEARKAASERCGIREDHVLICCSHTHSGPCASDWFGERKNPEGRPYVDTDYIGSLIDGIAGSVARAKAGAFGAKLGVGIGHCGAERGVGGNRRKQGGISDPSVGVIAVRDGSGELRGALVNYALHPTFLHEDSAVVTADYPGYIRQTVVDAHLRAAFGFAQGASGDQSSRYFRRGQSFDEAARVGSELGREALAVVDGMAFRADPKLVVLRHEVPLDLRAYPPTSQLEADLERKTAEYRRLQRAGAPYPAIQAAHVGMLGARAILRCAALAGQGASPEEEGAAEVMAIRLGDACVVGLPGECFVEHGLRIKRESASEKTLVFELANGGLPGYCYTEEASEEGGYEVDSSMLAPRFGQKLTDAAIDLARRIFE